MCWLCTSLQFYKIQRIAANRKKQRELLKKARSPAEVSAVIDRLRHGKASLARAALEPLLEAINKFKKPLSPEQRDWLLERVRMHVNSDKFDTMRQGFSLLFSLSRLNTPVTHLAWTSLLARVKDAVNSKPADIRPVDLAQALGALNHSKIETEVELVNAICAEALLRSSNFDAPALSAMLWALMLSPQTVPSELVQAMCKQVAARGGEFTTQEISHALLALSILRVDPGDAAVTVLCETTLAKAGSLTHLHMITIFGAFRRWQCAPSPEMVQGLCDQLAQRVSFLQPPDLADIMLTFVTLKLPTNHAVFALLQQEALKKSDRFNPREAAGIMWGVGSVGTLF
jgi:hypothetical protein